MSSTAAETAAAPSRDPATTGRLGEVLVHLGKAAPETVQKALELQSGLAGRLGTNLLELGAIHEGTLLQALGRQRATRTATGTDLRNVPAAVVQMIPAKLARRYRVVPFRLRGKTLWIASRDPVDALVEDEIGLLTGCMVKSCIGLEVRIFEALERYYRLSNPVRTSALAKRLNAAGRARAAAEAEPPADAPATVAADPEPRRAAPPRRPPRPAPASEPQYPSFIELDAEDEALLRRSAAPGEHAAPSAPAPANPAAEVEAPPTQAEATPAPPAAEVEAPGASAAAAGDGGSPAAAGEDVEERLHRAAQALQRAEIRDEIADVLLEFCGPYFRRRMLLIRRRDLIVGWRGEGEGVLADMVRGIRIHHKEPSVFLSVSGTGFWLGPLPPLPPNQNLILGLGGERPKDCVVLPITLMSKIVCYLYGDNMADGVAGAPIAELRRLAAKTAVAFEVYILKNKIRML